MRLHVDIETRSLVDLKKVGVYVYFAHPSTCILCVAWALDNDKPQIWYPRRSPMPDTFYEALCQAVEQRDILLTEHNASFERTAFASPCALAVGFPPGLGDVTIHDCTAARAALAGLPRTLEGACAALALRVQKDKEGHKLMMRMCKPKPKTGVKGVPPQWIEDDASLDRLGAYCIVDVEAEQALDVVVPRFPQIEREVWRMTERTNDRGVLVDTDLIYQLAAMIEDAERDMNARLHKLTGGMVPRVTDHGAISRWMVTQGHADVGLPSDEGGGIGKAILADLLARDDLTDLVRTVLEIRRDGGKSSASKYRAMCDRVSADGRIRGVLVYCGAASTARWSSRGVQLHNLPRGGKLADPLAAIYDLLSGCTLDEIEFAHGPPLVVASELLRPVIMAA